MDREIALAYAIVLYLIALVPKILAGAALLVFGLREMTLRTSAWRQWGGRV